MKKFLDLRTSGSDIIMPYLLIFLAYIIYFVVTFVMQTKSSFAIAAVGADPATVMASSLFFILQFMGLVFALYFVVYLLIFFIIKKVITGIEYNDTTLNFTGEFAPFFQKLIIGLLLSFVTIGIYFPWFISSIIRYFAEHSSYNGKPLKFNGYGLKLFLYALATLIPFTIVYTLFLIIISLQTPVLFILAPILFIGILVTLSAYTYLIIKWVINFSCDGITFKLSPRSEFYVIMNIALQIFLSLITILIYLPAADIRIVRMIAKNIVVIDNNNLPIAKVGCSLTVRENFGYIFLQYFLIIITFGIFTPWGLCNVYKTYLSNIYTEPIS